MSKYTAEQVEVLSERDWLAKDVRKALRDYAVILRERESVKPVAWLDMGKGEAQLVFSKKGQSNRAAKKEAIRLFESIPEGYHPLFLHPLMQSSKAAVTDEMIERAARAMCRKFDPPSSLDEMATCDKWRRFADEARCCLEAVVPMPASVRVPEGWMLVPVMPTPKMLGAMRSTSINRHSDMYQAALAAAPKPEEK